ncbi:MAG: hypothetical protein H0W74_09920 [Sphingosinicella sp.]|nr:hypothetical protein [Sphingosinicella sp.]
MSYETLGEADAVGALVWDVDCPDLGTIMSSQRRLAASDGWSRNFLSFTIPNGCPVQLMKLHIRPAGAGHADLWIDKIKVRPSGTQ